ncbi:MAG TPA: 6-phosphogluconolactonase [Candidatus Limnocylindrales bacterium]|nr:6-phosphogluconolactonase [Candidatus Limnocylindrales bacterium]
MSAGSQSQGSASGPQPAADPGEPRLIIAASDAGVAVDAADHVVASLQRALAERPTAHLALTGGSTATALYRLLARSPRREAVDWQRIELWWGDDRLVPPDHPQSNAGLVDATLLHTAALAGASDGSEGTDVEAGLSPGLTLPPEHVHPMPIGRALAETSDSAAAAAAAAAAYAAEVRDRLPAGPDGWPVFDLVLLGIGPDGHILSCFPGSPALADDAPLALGIPAPSHLEPHLPRVTLNPRIVSAARDVAVMAHGEAKAEVLASILTEPRDPQRYPADYARRAGATWFLDEACAADMPPTMGERH